MRKACTIPPKKSVCKRHARIFLDFFDFVEVEVHQRFAAENGHEDLETALVVVDGLDAAVEVLERAVLDADLLADLEFDLGTRLLGALLHLSHDGGHFSLGKHHGVVVAEELNDAWGGVDEMPRSVVHHHFDEDVAGLLLTEELAFL